MDWDQAVDVVVVGSGAAALTGAVTASLAGLRTTVLEKTAFFGGTSAYSGGGMWLPGTSVQRRYGVQDSVERGLTYLKDVVGAGARTDMLEVFCRTSPELVDFLETKAGLRFGYHQFPEYFPAAGRVPGGRAIYPEPFESARLGPLLDRLRPTLSADQYDVVVDRTRLTGGQSLIAQLLAVLRDRPEAELRTGCRVTGLIQEAGRVVGVTVVHEGSPRSIRADRGVLVAAGGFENNDDLRRAYQALAGGQWAAAPPAANTGDLLTAAPELQAQTALLDESWWAPATVFPNGRAAFTLGLRGGIFVDRSGQRFANESAPYDQCGRELRRLYAAEASHAAPVWWVFDSRTAGPPGIVVAPADLAEFERAGAMITAPSVGELAERIDVDRAGLTATVDRFNAFATDGVDKDFGRGEDEFDRFFGVGDGPSPALVPIDQAPFRAVRIVLGDLGTKGGYLTDEHARVLRAGGNAISGLYAAGNSAASIAASTYPAGGVPLALGMVFAHRAARHMS
jgi:3-oxosteroid 1-dehydrogenase